MLMVGIIQKAENTRIDETKKVDQKLGRGIAH